MKKKITFLKTLLVAAGLLGSSSAWAAEGDVTTNVDIDFSNAITGTNPYTIEGAVGKMTWTQQWTYAPTIVDGILRFGNFNGGVVELQNNNIGSKDVVTIKFDIAFGKLSGKHVGFDFKDKDGNTILTQWFDAYDGDFDNANPLNLEWNSMYHDSNEVIQERCVYFTITLDYAKSLITTNTTCYLSGTGKAATNSEFTASLPSSNPIASFVLQGNINNTGRYSTFDNLKITTTEGNYTAATANYTVNWVCNDNVLKTETRTGDVGTSISVSSFDKANFEDGENRYIYVDDDVSEKTVGEDGETVVTINFREASKYSYTITSSYNGEVLPYATSGTVWEDQNTFKVSYPRFQFVETTLVERVPVSNNLTKSITVSEDGYTEDLEYSATGITDLYLLSEAENLETGLSTNATTYTDRVSNRLIIHGSEGTLVTLPAGKYIFTLGVIGGDNNTHKVEYTASAGETQILSGTCTGNNLYLFASNEFTLYGNTDITFTCSDPASGRGIDLIYVQKTGDIQTLTSTPQLEGYKTFYNASKSFEVDDNTTIYKAAQVSGDKVVVTAVEGKVIPAGTPVILKTTADDYKITLTETAEAGGDFSGNALQVAAADGVVSGAYILAYTDASGFGFYQFTGSLDAGDVYVTAAAGAKLRIALAEDDATGIQTIASEVAEGAIYNVAGQRVNAAYKGIIIKNGKKYLNK